MINAHIQSRFFLSLPILLMSFGLYGQDKKGPLVFEKYPVASEAFESVNVLDVDKDGIPDLISGSFWYKGPDFVRRKHIGLIKRHGEYYDNFSTIFIDINGDGNKD